MSDMPRSIPETSAITHLIAGVPVSDLETSTEWYTRFFGRPADLRVGDEVLWDIAEHEPIERTRTASAT